MTTVCSPIPTLTTTDAVETTTDSVGTTDVVTSVPASFRTSFITTCISETGLSSCVPQTSTSVISDPGFVLTTQIPFTIAVDTVITQTTTLFGSSCSLVTGPNVGTPNPGTPGTPRITPHPSSSTIFSSSTIGPSGTVLPAQSTDSAAAKKFPIGAVVGGVIGGLALFAGAAFLLYKYFNKTSKFKGRFDSDSVYGKEDIDVDTTHPTLPSLPPHGGAAGGAAAFNAGMHLSQAHFAGQQGVQGQAHGQADNCDPQQYPLQQPQQPPPGQTGMEGSQYSTTQTGVEQQQSGYQWDGPHKLPQRVQNKLAEKIDQYIAGGGAAGIGAAATGYNNQQQQQQQQNPYQQQQQPSYGSYASSASPPAGSPPMNNAGFSAGPSYHPVHVPSSPPAHAHYGQQTTSVAVPGQSAFASEPQTPYQAQLAAQYKGYAEPSRELPNA